MKAAKRGAPAPAPGAWRGAPGSAVRDAIDGMLARLKSAPDVTLAGDSVASLFARAILDNRRVTNEQVLAMTRVPLEALQDSPRDRQEVLNRVPHARETDSHRFTVAMLSAATGIDPARLSELTPSLGLTGAAGSPLLFEPYTPGLQRSTALHDFTDYLRGAGLEGLNKAVWGSENRLFSAFISAIGGGWF